MCCAPFYGNRSVADKAEVSVWTVRKYRNKMKENDESLDVTEVDDERSAMVSEKGMEIIDKIVEEGLEQERGRI